MTTPTWPPEVVEELARRMYERGDLGAPVYHMKFDKAGAVWEWSDHWPEVADKTPWLNQAIGDLNAIAKAGEGKVRVQPDPKFALFFTPAPLEER